MNAPEKIDQLPDIQSSLDTRRLAIQKAGIRGMRHPVMVQTPSGTQPSVADVEMTVGLAADAKGTHMSRFIEVFQDHEAPLGFESIKALMAKMLKRLDAVEGELIVRLPYFISKKAPVSGVSSLMDYEMTWTVRQNKQQDVLLKLVVPVTSLCPCSKNISDYGAHNQRSHVTITVLLKAELNPEALVRVAEQAASCELWGLLKRPDEKYVTERAYDNPKFVEDLVRDIALGLQHLPSVEGFSVESENFESIHNHSAYAKIVHNFA
jgi:GTP cyclohydrolase I